MCLLNSVAFLLWQKSPTKFPANWGPLASIGCLFFLRCSLIFCNTFPISLIFSHSPSDVLDILSGFIDFLLEFLISRGFLTDFICPWWFSCPFVVFFESPPDCFAVFDFHQLSLIVVCCSTMSPCFLCELPSCSLNVLDFPLAFIYFPSDFSGVLEVPFEFL